MITTIIILSAILYLFIGLWICYKREWYENWETNGLICFIAIVFMPINLLILLIKEFVIREWDNC